mgnify:CR=1 FL=1
MVMDWQNDLNAPNGLVIDLDTGLPVSGERGLCVYVDEENGIYRLLVKTDGMFIVGADQRLSVKEYRGRVMFFAHGTPEAEAGMNFLRGIKI